MAIFKCKMCGGTLEIKEGESVAVCEYCGTRQTLPKLDDEKRANLYDRANHFRRCNEYDKAMGIYEQILAEDNTDAESYWSLVLCRYGVEYVEDPKTHKRVPTVNRTQFGSVFSDGDYQKALEYADEYQRAIYEEEAKAIDEIQKGILAISQEEEPFDVFICYKETDHNGRRTPDSVLAGELYHELTEEGFRVFFAKITLEDKLGSAYEPYIFAALNSAKVMVVLGTKPEYFNAAWVKNEWNRYLALIKNGAKKTLIPAYKDMEPYDLPEEFAHLQAQDMSKLGFMQDLIRGIEKLAEADKDEKQETKETTEQSAVGNAASLLKRVFIFLEDGDFESANTYCERVLDINPENAEAYLGKLMVVKEVRKKEQLAGCEWSIEEDGYYQKAIRYGDEAFVAEMKEYAKGSNRKQEEQLFREAVDKEQQIETAVAEKEKYGALSRQESELVIESYISLLKTFQSMEGEDAKAHALACQEKISEWRAWIKESEKNREERSNKREKTLRFLTIFAVVCCIAFLAHYVVVLPNQDYKAAMRLYEAGQYEEALESFSLISGFKSQEAREMRKECKYVIAKARMESRQYTEAKEFLDEIGDYKDAEEYRLRCIEKINETAGVDEIVYFGSYEQDNHEENGKEMLEWIVLEREGDKALILSRYGLEVLPYNTTNEAVTWETCSLRKWLNEDFLNTAFSKEEQKRIQLAKLKNKDNDHRFIPVNGGRSTEDTVFLLSCDEFEKYLKETDSDGNFQRDCEVTEYARTNPDGSCIYGRTWHYWLRSPGNGENCAAVASEDFHGSITVDSDEITVRPAIWVKLS